MKELSVKEKAKRYDEAIERARYWEKNPTVLSSDDICQKIFPELKKSENEKIRKELIEFVKSRGGFKQEYIAWLEKQGEQKPYGQRQECVDCQFNYAGECKGSCIMKRSEQKPVNYRIDYMSELTPFEKAFHSIATKYAQNLQKEWYRQSWYTKERAAEMLYWAKEELWLLDEQKPVEWSDEDEEMLKSILATCKMYAETVQSSPGSHLLEMQEGWLKSLRPQNKWKPGDKQMEVL